MTAGPFFVPRINRNRRGCRGLRYRSSRATSGGSSKVTLWFQSAPKASSCAGPPPSLEIDASFREDSQRFPDGGWPVRAVRRQELPHAPKYPELSVRLRVDRMLDQ